MISICLIAKDEEKWIGECVSHLKPLASEIIVADTGSRDATIQIAREAGATVFEIPWEENFAKARNATIERATEPWIFSFDCDERISARDLEKFKTEIEAAHLHDEIEAIRIHRRNYVTNHQIGGFFPATGDYPEGKNHPGYYVEHMVRIFRNRPHIRWTGNVHELIDPSLKGQILESDLIFHHYGYLPEEEARRGKTKFYQDIGKKKLAIDPNNWKAHYDLGCEFIPVGEFQKAVEEFELAIKLRPNEPMILNNMGYALMELGQFEKSEEVLRQSMKINPTEHDAQLNLGVNLMRQGLHSAAAEVFQSLTAAHPKSFLALRNLGLCFIYLKQWESAAKALKLSLEIFPTYADAKLDLAVIHFMIGQKNFASSQIKEVQESDPQNQRALDMMKQMRLE